MMEIRRDLIPAGMQMGGRVNLSTLPEILQPYYRYNVSGASGSELIFSASDSSVELADLKKRRIYIMHGEVEDGLLSWEIFARDRHNDYVQHPDMNGTDFYRSAFIYLSQVAELDIEAILGFWINGSNYEKYLNNLRNGLSVTDAALNTWAGRMASEHGYSRVTLPDGTDEYGYNPKETGYTFHFKR